MADTVDINSIDGLLEKAKLFSTIPEEMKKEFSSLESLVIKAAGSVDKFVSSINSADPTSINTVTTAVSALLQQTEHFKNIGNINIDFKSNFQSYKQQFADLKSQLFSSATDAKDMGALESVWNKAKEAGLDFAKLAMPKNLEQARAAIVKGLGSLTDTVIQSLATQLDTQQNLKLSFYEAALAGGTLNKVLMNTDGLQTMEEHTKNLTIQLAGAVRETHMLPDVLAGLQRALQTAIPRSIEEKSISLGEIFAQISMSGRTASEVVKELTDSFDRYGKTQDESLIISARYSQLQEETGKKMSFIKGYLDSVSSAFKDFGESSEGASKIFAALSKGFGDNVSQQQSVEIIKKYTEGVVALSTAQKAFLSQQTGGPGGLMGAFQIEKDLREGKIDKVFERVQQSMRKQFGGQIVTLDQAAISPKAAAQYQKQVAILTQGALGSMVDQNQAKAAIDAMAKGGTGKDVQSAIQGTAQDYRTQMIDRGTELRRSGQTGISQYQADMSATKLLSGAQAYSTSKRLVRVGEEERKDVQEKITQGSKSSSVMETGQKELQMQLASSVASMANIFTKLPEEMKTVAEAFRKTIRESSTPTTNANQKLIEPVKSTQPQTVIHKFEPLKIELDSNGSVTVTNQQLTVVPTK
jgi:hypothetical protein